MGNWAHPHQPRDKDWKKKYFNPDGQVSHRVILATPMAIKVHHSWIKNAEIPAESNNWQAVCDPINPLKLRFQRMLQHNTFAWEELQICSSHFPEAAWSTHNRRLRIHPPGH
jgi:hypothetical protein